jgi:hypothetical protein
VTLAAMPLTHNMVLWLVLRLTAGIASAATFVAAVGVGRSLGCPAPASTVTVPGSSR